MNRRRKKKAGNEQQDWSVNLDVVHPNAAGIDIGNESHYVAVPPDRDAEPVRQFACFTEALQQMAAWLKSCGIDTVVTPPWRPICKPSRTRISCRQLSRRFSDARMTGEAPCTAIGKERGRSHRPALDSRHRSDGDDLRRPSGARACWDDPDRAEPHRSRLLRQTLYCF
jgi:hypothetical protein